MRSIFFAPLRRNIFIIAAVISVIFFFLLFSDFSYQDEVMNPKSLEESKHLHGSIYKIKGMVAENKAMIGKLQRQLDENRQVLLSKVSSHLMDEVKGLATVNKSSNAKENKDNKILKQGEKKVIPVLVTACNRPTVSRCLNGLLELTKTTPDEFPILVSQDCNDQPTAKVLEGYKDKITYVKHPPVDPIKLTGVKPHLQGYYKLSMHYKWAIAKTFESFPTATAIIIVEDDIEVAVDFFSYFSTMHDLLMTDSTLWCASAWNDNGKSGIIDESIDGSKLLYRTDFFPGLGWMLMRSLWTSELSSKWPDAFWDDWMRKDDQRKGRACIRPEISRTTTFGKKGVSNGQFYEKHLKYIKLNPHPIDWSKEDLSYLIKERYDKEFLHNVYNLPTSNINDISKSNSNQVRLEYNSAQTFKSLAKAIGLMEDFKDGVPRTAYKGIVTSFKNNIRVYLSPPSNWNGYDKSWT